MPDFRAPSRLVIVALLVGVLVPGSLYARCLDYRAASGRVDTSGFASAVTVSGLFAYVADGTAGMEMIDVSEPTSPAVVGS
jgi:hypothetical protein